MLHLGFQGPHRGRGGDGAAEGADELAPGLYELHEGVHVRLALRAPHGPRLAKVHHLPAQLLLE